MTEREAVDFEELKKSAYREYGGCCAFCGASLDQFNFHMAHLIPQGKTFLRMYGKKVIYDRENMVPTCPTDRCNNGVNLKNKPIARERLATRIREKHRRAAYAAG